MLKRALAAVAANPDARGAPGHRGASAAAMRPIAAGAGVGVRTHAASSRASPFVCHQLGKRSGAVNNASNVTNALVGRATSSGRHRRAAVVPAALFGNNKSQPAASPPEPAELSVPIDELVETTRRGIKSYGYDDNETKILLDVMMYAQLRGNNQGIIKVTTKGIARDPAAGPITAEHETMLSACFNGNKNAGMVVLHKAMETAVEKAKVHGFGVCGTNNTSTSTGALGYYAETVAKQGMIALVLAVSPEFVAPNGAIEPIFGTNPIGVGIPTKNGPVVLDMVRRLRTISIQPVSYNHHPSVPLRRP